MWSLGCIAAELRTGRVLFQNDSLSTLLARVVGILGEIDDEVLAQGRYSHRFFTKHKILYDRVPDDDRSFVYIFPKRTTLKHRLATDDELFLDFVHGLLTVDPKKRLTARTALNHPWIHFNYGDRGDPPVRNPPRNST
jgi:serine/threonine protein kinase